MRRFWSGFGIAVLAGVVVLAGLFVYIRFGFVDSRADIPVSGLEKATAMPALDASVERRAPDIKNPVAPTDANLLAGMRIYQTNCASCHGDINHPRGKLAEALYPRAPQFLEDAPDMPENQNFFIIQHGIRLSGMPAWKQVLSDQQMWQVTTFLSHMNKLPPQVSDQWKALVGDAGDVTPQHNSSSMDKDMHMK
ncbi:MAG: c-type cytochrome [Candidatus Acidiferrales bacterium]